MTMRFRAKEKRYGLASAGKLLDSLLIEIPALSDALAIERIRMAWPRITGSLSKYSMPDKIENMTLFIKTTHPAISNELSMIKRSIIETVQIYSNITNIKFM